MKRALTLVVAALCGCSSGIVPVRPRGEDVDAMEQKIALNPCINSFKQWTKIYSYEAHPLDYAFFYSVRKFNYDVIEFSYFQRGIVKLTNDRNILARDPTFDLYIDGHFRFAAGSYNLKTRTLTVDFCGWADRPYG